MEAREAEGVAPERPTKRLRGAALLGAVVDSVGEVIVGRGERCDFVSRARVGFLVPASRLVPAPFPLLV